MEQLLYLECSAGISGDMVVAALLDAGASEQKLRGVLESLDLGGFSVEITRVKKSGLDACDFNVVLDAAHDGHDHDMTYLYGHDECEGAHGSACNAHDDASGRQRDEGEGAADDDSCGTCDGVSRYSYGAHGNAAEVFPDARGGRSDKSDAAFGYFHHAAGDHHEHHEHRTLAEITAIIDASSATQHAKDLAKRIFSVLADAEAKAHGVPAKEVHFHEVGAVDSIVDILAAAVCLDDLAPSGVIVSRLCEGQGMVRCQHGVIPVPVPAVVNIAAAYDIPLSVIDAQGELVTPTGAAFVAAARTASRLPETFTVTRVGLGAGKRVYPETSGVLRAFLIPPVASEALDRIVL